jgi:hypothetical protein
MFMDNFEKLQKIRDLVDEQANDEAIWTTTERIVEAYIQQELRRLHQLIEDMTDD